MGQFTLDLNRAINKAKVSADLVVKKVTIDIFNHVIMRTPVDTGRARGAWQVGWNQIPRADVDKEDNKSPVTRDGSGESLAKEDATRFVIGSTSLGGIVYLANNMPYIKFLEYGSSQQSAQGMVRITIQEYQDDWDNKVSKLK